MANASQNKVVGKKGTKELKGVGLCHYRSRDKVALEWPLLMGKVDHVAGCSVFSLSAVARLLCRVFDATELWRFWCLEADG